MILRQYMTRQVAVTTALVVGFLVVLLLGGRMIRYFGIAAEGRLDIGLLFSIIGYNIPYFLELILPLSFFIGLMLIFGRLYVDSEMAVLNSSGISRGQLARLITPLIVVLFIMEAGLSLFAKPWGVGQSDTIWQEQSLNSAFDLIRPQSFISSDDYHLYVGSMNEDRGELRDVILIQTAEADKRNEVDNPVMSSDMSIDMSSDLMIEDEAHLSANLSPDSSIESLNPSTINTVPTASINSASASNNNNNKENEVLAVITNPTVATQQAANQMDLGQLVDTDAANMAKDGPSLAVAKDVIVLAKRAVQVQGEYSDKTQLDLFQGRRYEIDADSLAYTQVSFERYRISIDRPPMDSVNEDNVATQTLPVLWRAATGQAQAGDVDSSSDTLQTSPSIKVSQQVQYQQQILPAQAELGYRLALPWLMIIAPMLAVPLAQVRPRQGRWIRLLPAIIIFASCALVIISLKSPVTKGRLSVWVYPLAILSFMLLALYFNWASRIHHRVRFGLNLKSGRSS